MIFRTFSMKAYVEKMENAGIEDLDEAKKKRLM